MGLGIHPSAYHLSKFLTVNNIYKTYYTTAYTGVRSQTFVRVIIAYLYLDLCRHTKRTDRCLCTNPLVHSDSQQWYNILFNRRHV